MRVRRLSVVLGLALAGCTPTRWTDLFYLDLAPDRMWWVTPLRVWAPYPAPVLENRP